MFMRRQDYVQIPTDLKVWRGDDYLFRRQVRRNLVMLGIDIRTHMSTTSDDPAFDAVKEADMQAFADLHGEDSYRLRFWKEFRISRAVRSSGSTHHAAHEPQEGDPWMIALRALTRRADG